MKPMALFLLLILLASWIWTVYPAAARPGDQIQQPVLKWENAGCYGSWCETGWYSSAAVVDLDGDGNKEVIASTYTIFVLDGASGSLKWHMPSGHDRSEPEADNVGRTWPGIVVADVDGDTLPEIVTAHSGGYVSVYDHQGYFQAGWPKQPTDRELRGLSVYDLDADGTMEIIVTAAGSAVNTWVYEHNGFLRPGWPQLADDSGFASGIFNDNAAIGDIDGDDQGELVVPSDMHYICAYEADGSQIPANAMYEGKGWGKVGVWESMIPELRGWGTCSTADGREERYRTNFAHGPAATADMDGDGSVEVVATGNVYDCAYGHPPGKYNGVYVFHADRSRFVAGSYDWQAPPIDTGAPLSESYSVIESNQPNPAIADLDGDGEMEIIYASYDGRVHAFWLDKTEHGNWPYSVYNAGEGFYRFASEPAVADLDNDGQAEVIFASWVQKGTNRTGKLHILSSLGSVLQEVNLPPAYGSPDWNGVLPAPTLDDIDGDADLEVVLNSAHSGVLAYDLPGTANARVLWGTGRGNYQRTASVSRPGTLKDSTKRVSPLQANSGDTLRYTIVLRNPGPTLDSARVTDTLPASVGYLGDLWASAGSYGESGGVITWSGSVQAGVPVTITFGVTLSLVPTTPYAIANTALIDDGLGNVWSRQAGTVVNGLKLYLPLVQRGP